MTVRIRVSSAGPLVSFQDGGRRGHMRFGVPASGPMDRVAHAAANVAVGNAPDATAIEVSLGGLVFEVASGSVTIGVAGGAFAVDLNGSTMPEWEVVTVTDGECLTVRPGSSGSWTYVAVAGNLVVPTWLGHTATHSMSGFGGGALVSGSEFDVSEARVVPDRSGEIPRPGFRAGSTDVRVVIGPQAHQFESGAIESFRTQAYTLTDAYDRMGVRLSGPSLPLAGALSIPSEPIVRGSVQVTGDGVPAVLLADHQTTGGYPKIATLLSADLDGFVQRRAGDTVRFEAVTPAEAVAVARVDAELVDEYLRVVGGRGRTLAHRLREQNLIGGVVRPPAGETDG